MSTNWTIHRKRLDYYVYLNTVTLIRFMYLYAVINCGSPPSLPIAAVSHGETSFGHIAKYTCPRGNWFNRNQRQIVTKCEENGDWTHLDDTCKGMCLHSCDSVFSYSFNTDLSNTEPLQTLITMHSNNLG